MNLAAAVTALRPVTCAFLFLLALAPVAPTHAATPLEDAVYKYDHVGPLVDGLARVRLQNAWGFIDATGREVVPPQYSDADDFRDGLTLVAKDEQRWGVISAIGSVVVPLEHKWTDLRLVGGGIVRIQKDRQFALLDRKGQPLTSQRFDRTADEFSEDRLAVAVGDQWGFVDGHGHLAIPPRFSFAGNFKDGLAKVTADGARQGFIDRDGREVIPQVYVSVGEFSEGLVSLAKNTAAEGPNQGRPAVERIRFGFVDRTGKLVLPFEYQGLFSINAFVAAGHPYFSEGLAAVRLASGKPAYVDRNGKVALEPNYDAITPFDQGLAIVGRRNGSESDLLETVYHLSLIDRSGKVVTPREYDVLRPFSDGLAAVAVGQRLNLATDRALRNLGGTSSLSPGKWGFIDRTGKEVIELRYDHARDFYHGFAAVNLGAAVGGGATFGSIEGGKWGLIDTTGEVVVPIRFDRISNVDEEGNVTLTEGRQSRKINVKGLAAFQKGVAAAQSQNHAETLRWFSLAAQQGHATAVGNVGLMHLQGVGVPRNPAKGTQWLTWAADRGDAQSLFNLGLLHADAGQFDAARDRLQKAQAAGHPQAATALSRLAQLAAPAISQPAAPSRERERTR